MKNMNKRESKKIAVMAAVIVGLMMFAFMPLASAEVTSFSVTPSSGVVGVVDSYNVLVTTIGVTSINITIPAGFIAVAPATGGVQIARVDFWNSNSKAYYGYATVTSNNANPTGQVDIYCDFGGDVATSIDDVKYNPGESTSLEVKMGNGTAWANITLPEENKDGRINITIDCWSLDLLEDVNIAIGQFVRNPTTAGDYDFKAEEQVATVTIKSSGGLGSAVFRNGQWFIDETGNQKTDKYFVYGGHGCDPVVAEFGSNDYGVFDAGRWYIDTDGDQKTNLEYWYGWDKCIPVPGDYDGNGTLDLGVFYEGMWYIDTNRNGKTNETYWYGWAGCIPVPGDYDDNGTLDLGVFYEGMWYIDTDRNGKTDLKYEYGWEGFKPVPGDYNNDGTLDLGVFIGGHWYIDMTRDSKTNLNYCYGIVGDKPIIARDLV